MTDTSGSYYTGKSFAGTAAFNAAYKESRYKFPLDFHPSIDGLSEGESSTMRRLICIGAEWLQRNPDKTPDGPEFRLFYEKLNPLGGTNEKTLDTLTHILQDVKEKSFGCYIEELRAQKATQASALNR